MRRSDFHYTLPPALIAQHPAEPRSAARLLSLTRDGCADRAVRDLPALLAPGDLLVLNDTRVIPARLYGRKTSGGRVELLVERILGPREVLAHIRASKSPRAGGSIEITGTAAAFEVLGRADEFYRLRLRRGGSVPALLEAAGHVPLPPYIARADRAADRERYQTVYARHPGAVAAPTAGLHFDAALLEAVRRRGVRIATVTLHVGAGTFQPVRVDDLAAHRMHAEWYQVDAALCEAVAATRAGGGRVVAVGTTVVRTLETAVAPDGMIAPRCGETRLFITPGYRFRAVDALLTNFHLPQSTLLMLVCAFGGQARVIEAYRHAVAQGYRFYSYGDAMWVEREDRA